MADLSQNPPLPVNNAVDEALLPSASRVVYSRNTPNNYYIYLAHFLMRHQVVMDILRGHLLHYALTATVVVPDIYLQQFWHTVAFTTSHGEETVIAIVDATEVTVTLDELRMLLHLPQADDGGTCPVHRHCGRLAHALRDPRAWAYHSHHTPNRRQ